MQPTGKFEDTKKDSFTPREPERLPPLGLTSLGVFIGLYSLTFGLIVLLVQYGRIQNVTGLIFMGVFVLGQFLLGPWIMDWSLRTLGSLKWMKYEELPPHLSKFITATCEAKRIKPPRMGIIDDGAPNAFTYGNTSWNARIAITRGVLEMLDEREVRAVIAHELGHITHADFIFMTLAQMVPVLLYQIFRYCSGGSGGSSKKGGNPLAYAAIVAYVFYLLSQYIVLFLSRLREYWADRFSVEVTRDPMSLITALMKVAYGYAARADAPVDEGADAKTKKKAAAANEMRQRKFRAIQAMGISDVTKSSVLSLYAAQGGGGGGAPPASAMAWDLKNPWARFYELQSTHPMTAKRIKAIANQGATMGIDVKMRFPTRDEGAVGWGTFLYEAFIKFLPYTMAVMFALVDPVGSFSFTGVFLGFALGSILRFTLCYPNGPYEDARISALLEKVEASPVKSIPVQVQGKIIGRGIPGYIFSKDFILQDDTGFIFLDYDNPIPFFNFFFGLLRSGKFQGAEVIVEGWYRRAPMPYIEIRRMKTADGKVVKCYRRGAALFFYWGMFVLAAGATVLSHLAPHV